MLIFFTIFNFNKINSFIRDIILLLATFSGNVETL